MSASRHLTGTLDTDFSSPECCARWHETKDRENDEEYRVARANVIFAARDRLQEILGYTLSLMEQRYIRDIAFDVVPWAMEQRLMSPPPKNMATINPVQETVARYMRDVLRVSIEELRELKKVFGKERVLKALSNHHEAIHCP
jgi:hypothetical protein